MSKISSFIFKEAASNSAHKTALSKLATVENTGGVERIS